MTYQAAFFRRTFWKKGARTTPAEIRERAFEIHIERGGFRGCGMDGWLQAEGGLQEKYHKSHDGRQKKK